MNTEPIVFRQGEENGIVIERDHFERSIFKRQYQQAINIFNRVRLEQKRFISRDGESSGLKDFGLDNQLSNIIAFCGDRGEGKSSCMSSFALMLTNADVREKAAEAVLETVEKELNGKEEIKVVKVFQNMKDLPKPKEIELLDAIDPSFFDVDHNLLELLLGKMFARVTSDDNSTEKQRYKSHATRLLIEQFHAVKNDMSMMLQKEKVFDSLVEISELSAGVRLKNDIEKLFDLYLEYVGKKQLLICIDDIDLNTNAGYEMAEMLRKYLICSQCVILVAVKVEQMIDVIAAANFKGEDIVGFDWEHSKIIAQKYVAKLFPRGHRIAMPSPTDFCDLELKIADSEGKIDEKETVLTIKEKIAQMIFQKTGYVFYNTQHLSPIIPKNLRSLRHLLGLLQSLPDARDEKWEDDETGRIAFKDYFFNTWATKLNDNDYAFAQQLAQYDDLPTMNAFVIQYFAKRVDEIGLNIQKTNVKDDLINLYVDIVSNRNTATNLSYGDVMYVLWLVSGISLNADIQNLIFLIKTVYSMRLYACYNAISSNEDSLYPPQPDVETTVFIHKADTQYEHVNQLQKLVNGSFFTYPQGFLLPRNTEKNDFRDRKAIRLDVFDQLAKEYTAGNVSIQTLNMCEFVALCVIRTVLSEEKKEDRGHNRTNKTPAYLGQLSTDSTFVMFDFLQPFTSLCNIEYAYHRFDDILAEKDCISLYEIAINNTDSILRKMLKECSHGGNKWDDKHRLISDAVVRISDVQWAIYDELLRKNHSSRKGDDRLIMLAAYTAIINLRIKLYQLMRKEDNDAHIIDFKFLKVLHSYIKDIENETLENTLYISEGEIANEEVRKFANDLAMALMRVLFWPMRGQDVVKLASNVSGLKSTQKGILTRSLNKLFTKDTQYGNDEVRVLTEKIVLAYIDARQR